MFDSIYFLINKFKKSFTFMILIYLLSAGFLGIAQDSDDDDLNLFFDQEEITCENVVDIFAEYNNIIKLMEDSFGQSLKSMSQIMHDMENDQLTKETIKNEKQQLNEAISILNQNKEKTFIKGEGILSVIQNCMTSKTN